MHPFLDPRFHVRWSTLTPESVEPDIRHALALAESCLEAIRSADHTSLTYENTFAALGKATEPLSRGWEFLNHLDSVCDDPAQRTALNVMLPEVSNFYSAIALDDRLWSVLKTYGCSEAVKSLDPVQQRYIEETMRDFIQSGADLPPGQKTRISEIEAELSQLTQEYSEHVLDSTNAWERLIEDESRLAGLPLSARDSALANAKAKGLGTDEKPIWRFTLHEPSMTPVMQYSDDEALRREAWEASQTIGTGGGHDNTARVWRILELRREKAVILGHPHFADLTLQRCMAKNGATALRFTEDLHARVHATFLAEYQQLRAYKATATQTPIDDLQPWEVGYWAERQRKECYDLDDEALRLYFSVDGVMTGMFELASQLFGIRIQQRETVYYERGNRPADAPEDAIEVWHPEVTFYDLHDSATGRHLGSFYADWHPRESKRGGAWMNCLHTGGPTEPHLGLITGNMSPPINGQPARLTHGEVETVFHEFGHLLHGLLSEVSVKALSGTNVPTDFVELPSQIMENYCWDRASLDLFARHLESGEPIPTALFEKMMAAQNYRNATSFIRQLSLGKLDLELHMHLDRYHGRDLDEVEREILADYRAPLKTDGVAISRRFSHLFSYPTGYAAGYYSYKWSEVLDADAFTRFQKEGILNPETGRSFREHILSKGNSAPVDELYRRFMGRDPKLEPLLVRSGLAVG